MSDISSVKPEQKSNNKAAIVAIFLFAGVLFIWQFIEEESKKNLNTAAQTHQIKNNSPKIKRSATFSNKTTLSNRSDKTKKLTSKSRVTFEEKPANTGVYRTKKPSKLEPLIPVSKKITTNNLNLALLEIPNISSPFEYKELILDDQNAPEIKNALVDYQTLLLTDQETPKTNIEKTNKQLKKTDIEPKDYSIQSLLPISHQKTDNPFDQINILTPKVQQQTSIPNFDIALKQDDELTQQINSFSRPIKQPKIQSASVVTTDLQGQPKIQTVPLVKTNKPRANKVKQHKIKQGETLYSLSRRYNVSLNSLLQSNTISKKSRIKIGQIITIPLDS